MTLPAAPQVPTDATTAALLSLQAAMQATQTALAQLLTQHQASAAQPVGAGAAPATSQPAHASVYAAVHGGVHAPVYPGVQAPGQAPGPAYAPASHRLSYPPPPGGPLAAPPFDAARSDSVSSQSTHNAVVVSANNSSPVHMYFDRDRDSTSPARHRGHTTTAARRPLDTAFDPFLDAMPANLERADPVLSDKTPATPEALKTSLFAFYDNSARRTMDQDKLVALGQYVRATLQLLEVADARHVLAYHQECTAAHREGRYDIRRDGAVFGTAHSLHIAMNGTARAAGRNTRGSRGGKRKERESSPSHCSLPGHAGHSAERCFTTHPELRPSAAGGKERSIKGESTADSSAAAAAAAEAKEAKKAKKAKKGG